MRHGIRFAFSNWTILYAMPNLMIDRSLTHVFYAGGRLEVNDMEFEILWTLANKPGRTFTADDLTYLINPSDRLQKSAIRVAMESLAVKLAPWVCFDQRNGFKFIRS